MRTVPHRELRNDSAQILAAVKAGAIIEVTNGGELAAIMVPPGTPRLEVLRLAGRVSDPQPLVDLDEIVAVVADETTQVALDELRGER